MIEACILLGLSRDVATELIIQTMVGSAKMLRDTGKHPVELREMVTSPGGTTIMAIKHLEQAGVRAAFLNAIDAATLSEAARSLGARWSTVMFRIIAPNMWQAILNALLLTVALVLGEFTVAYLLTYVNLQVELFSISRNTTNAGVLFSASAATLLFGFALLLILSYAGRRLRRGRP